MTIFEEAKIVAINDPEMGCEEIAHALKYDSDYGQFNGDIQVHTSNSRLH